MRVSRNEMIAALSRAYEGAGHNIGDYEDAAQLVCWAQMCGLGTFENIALPPVGPQGSATPRLVFENDGMAVIDAGGADVCEHGSLAAHLTGSKAQKTGFAVVQLANCRYPVLILRCLSLIAQKGLFISTYWKDRAGAHGASFESGEIFPHYWHVEDANTLSDISTITIICADQAALLADAVAHQVEFVGTTRHELSSAQLANNYDRSLERGVEVDEEHWNALNAAAWPILVPASSQSRAGAGPT